MNKSDLRRHKESKLRSVRSPAPAKSSLPAAGGESWRREVAMCIFTPCSLHMK